MFIIKEQENKAWLVDESSSSHISNDENVFSEIKLKGKTSVVIVKENKLTSYGSGNTKRTTKTSYTYQILKQIFPPLVKPQKIE